MTLSRTTPDALAFIAFGSGDPAKLPAANPATSYVAVANAIAPRLKSRNVTRLLMHNLGGQHFPASPGYDSRPMRVDQWPMSERRRYPFADRYDLRTAIGILEESAGVTEVIVYVGSPTQLLDPVKELPQVLEAFTDCGPVVSFGFDAMFEDGVGEKWQDLWAKGSPYRKALANLRKKHKVYTEARIHPEQLKAGLGELVDGTIAQAKFDRAHPYAVAEQPGEYIRVTDSADEAEWPKFWSEVQQWEAGVTPAFRAGHNWGPLLDKVKEAK